jgi:hypothetical protein
VLVAVKEELRQQKDINNDMKNTKRQIEERNT